MKRFKIGEILVHKEFSMTLEVIGWCSWIEGENYACVSIVGTHIYPVEFLKDYFVKIGSL